MASMDRLRLKPDESPKTTLVPIVPSMPLGLEEDDDTAEMVVISGITPV